MNISEHADQDVVARLRQARDQVDGVVTLLESGHSCREVVTHLAAASKALDAAGYTLIATSMQECLVTDPVDGGGSVEELEQLFIRLA